MKNHLCRTLCVLPLAVHWARVFKSREFPTFRKKPGIPDFSLRWKVPKEQRRNQPVSPLPSDCFCSQG